MANVKQLWKQANEAFRAGRQGEAEDLCRRILELDPWHVDALHLLGHLCQQRSQYEEALAHLKSAVNLAPDHPYVQRAYGETCAALGKMTEAAAAYRRAIHLKPDFAEAYLDYGNPFQKLGRWNEALACYRKAIALKPNFAAAYSNMGTILRRDPATVGEAIECFRRALNAVPQHAGAHNNLGNLLAEQGRHEEALRCFQQAIRYSPEFAEAHNNLGLALRDTGRLHDAFAAFRRALELKPQYAEAHNNLGTLYHELGKAEEAIASYRQAIVLNPSYVYAHNNLGAILGMQGRFTEALAAYREALRLQPTYAESHTNLAGLLRDMGRFDEARAHYAEALRLQPMLVKAHSNLLMCEQYVPGVTPEHLAALHAEWQQRHAVPLQSTWQPHENDRSPDRRLRLGFVSADFGAHPVGYFLVGFLEALPREGFEVLLYSDRAQRDVMTARLAAASDAWFETRGLSDSALAEKIRCDRIDILFDLAGHTARHRLLVFARKPAPIQATWMGYVGTTGLAAIDYLITDRWHTPAGVEPAFVERLLRLADGYVCYTPPDAAPPVAPPPCLQQDHITFGSFNNGAKINDQVLELWARILAAVPDSRLYLKYRGLDDPAIRERLDAVMRRGGIDPTRVETSGRSSSVEMLEAYSHVDIALDPFPYSGGLTTCEALWMGVPTVTLPGRTFAGRHSLSHLSNVGLDELVVSSPEEYVAKAVALAQDRPKLGRWRSTLREKVSRSPLCDAPRFARQWGTAIREVWSRWCAEGSAPRPTQEAGA